MPGPHPEDLILLLESFYSRLAGGIIRIKTIRTDDNHDNSTFTKVYPKCKSPY